MKQLDAATPSRMAAAGVARSRALGAELGGHGIGMYACGWRAGTRYVTTHTSFVSTANPQKVLRPEESSP